MNAAEGIDAVTTAAAWSKLRAPFEPSQIGVLPKPYQKDAPKSWCAICQSTHGQPAVHLDYVGHAAVTHRLLEVDPSWSWEPIAVDASGLPVVDKDGGMWIRLTVLGVTKLGYGDAAGKAGANATKERIGDALRNAAMRFGVGLDLWHKGELLTRKDEDEGDSPPKAEGKPDAAPPAKPELPPYTVDEFNKNLPAWRALIAGGKDPARIIAMVSSKRTLSAKQRAEINRPLDEVIEMQTQGDA